MPESIESILLGALIIKEPLCLSASSIVNLYTPGACWVYSSISIFISLPFLVFQILLRCESFNYS
jgi:hypothetical protein